MRIALFFLSFALSTGSVLAANKKSGKAHEHGHGRLSVAVEDQTIRVSLDVPAEGIFGFEHIPHNDADKKKVSESLKTLRERATQLFVFPADRACEATQITVTADQETGGEGGHAKPHDKHAHADLVADYTFVCKGSLAGQTLKLGLLREFPRIKKLQVQILTGSKQEGMTATAKKDTLPL